MYSSSLSPSKSKQVAMLFIDIQVYSILSEDNIQTFSLSILPLIADVIKEYRPFYLDTMGDGVVAIFHKSANALSCAMKLHEIFGEYSQNFQSMKMALHLGFLTTINDPIKKGINVVGPDLNVVARLARYAKPGQIWATSNYISGLSKRPDKTIAFDDLGNLFFTLGRLYRIRKTSEPSSLAEIKEYARAKLHPFHFSQESLKEVISQSLEKSGLNFNSIDGPDLHVKGSKNVTNLKMVFILNGVTTKDFPVINAQVAVYMRYNLPSKTLLTDISVFQVDLTEDLKDEELKNLFAKLRNSIEPIIKRALDDVVSFFDAYGIRAWIA